MLDNTRPPGTGQDPPAHRRNLRLVHPQSPQKQGDPSKPRGRHQRRDPFTPDEQARLKAALRNARGLFGTWACLGDALGIVPDTAQLALRRHVSAEIAVRLARALGKPLEALLRAPTDVARCAACGARKGAP